MLQKNERLVLQHLTQNARTTDSAMAERIGISTQAIGKIRHKLEEQGIIASYTATLNPEAIGLNVVTVGVFTAPPHIIQHEEEFRQRVRSEPNIVYCHRLLHSQAQFLLLFAFRTLEEKEEYMSQFQRLFPGMLALHMHTSSWDSVWKFGRQDVETLAVRDQPAVAFKNIPCKHGSQDDAKAREDRTGAKTRAREM